MIMVEYFVDFAIPIGASGIRGLKGPFTSIEYELNEYASENMVTERIYSGIRRHREPEKVDFPIFGDIKSTIGWNSRWFLPQFLSMESPSKANGYAPEYVFFHVNQRFHI